MVVAIETGRHEADEVTPQEFVAVTHRLPPVVPDTTSMVLVPCPEEMVHPAGTVQVYETAPATGCMEYVRPARLGQTEAMPVMLPGVGMVLLIETA
jgi:hypothetical protein